MTTMTVAEARAAGLLDGPIRRAKAKTTQRAVPATECAPNRCCTCSAVFTAETAERRHSDTTRHRRFEMVTS